MKQTVLIFIFTFLFLTVGYCSSKKENSLLAFPSAEGSGAMSVGGRGGIVVEVTNLNADGEGSFKDACERNGSRTVVFRVGGTIDLGAKNINIFHDNITIAGQTALGDGIQIKNGGINIQASEVIVRYLRIRPGPAHAGVDALTIASPNRHNRKKNIIIDHLSTFWGVDETMDSGSFSDNITIQWTIIAEGLHASIYTNNGKKENWNSYGTIDNKAVWRHSRGVMITENSHNISLHHNLIFNNYKRNPLIQSSDVDFVNNVVVNYQYQGYVQPFKGKVEANFIGNYFRSYIHNRPPIRVFDYNRGYDGNSSIYYKDNYDSVFRPSSTQAETDIRILHINKKKIDLDGHVSDREKPFPFLSVHTQPVHIAYTLVLENVGTNYPKRDSVDQRVISFIKSGKAPKEFVNHPKDVGGWAKLPSRTFSCDSDHDGIPDKWEKKHGLNPHNILDGNEKGLSSLGYTNLEIYLNSLPL